MCYALHIIRERIIIEMNNYVGAPVHQYTCYTYILELTTTKNYNKNCTFDRFNNDQMFSIDVNAKSN